MPSIAPEFYVALTDRSWFDYLTRLAGGRPLDEVNFWSPRSRRPMKRMRPGAPVFFRLKKPYHVVVGYGFFAHHCVLDLDLAWTMFGEKNGDPDKLSFLRRIGEYRDIDLLDPRVSRAALGCTLLRDAVFWSENRWIPWASAQGWPTNTQQGVTVRRPDLVDRLWREVDFDQMHVPEDFAPSFEPLDVDERVLVLAPTVKREGQGAFRSRLLHVYGSQCAITGERTEPVLDAAHVQPYLGPRSNHVQNGLLLTKEFHALFDAGLVTVTVEYKVKVSPRIRERWKNGHRYYPFNDRELRRVPEREEERPSPKALLWHNRHAFVA